MLEERIHRLRSEILEFAYLVQAMIEKSIEGLVRRQRELLEEVIERDEPKANEKEILIDELCITTIAQFQPVARDLRMILMTFGMNTDLERIADHAVNIAENSLFLIERPPVKPLIDIPRMAEISAKMLKDSVEAFTKEDVRLARSVCERDDLVDGLMQQILRELVTYMGEEPKVIERAIRLITIARNLERIADLSTNLSEDVIYMVEGKIIKHHKDV
jgi:phosphate transport system protein